jgi:N6-adenosine-specific RNA methylase IME4
MNKKYNIIYADPPWSFNNKKTGGSFKSGALYHYNTMSTEEMCKLKINEIAAEDSVLFMRWVGSQPKEAILLAESWGFKIKTMTGFNWVKTTRTKKLFFGMGFWTRAGSECCLIATKGKPKRVDASIRSVILSDIDKHSKKPNIFRQEIIKLCGDLPRIELFARERSEGFDVFGNEVDDSIKL